MPSRAPFVTYDSTLLDHVSVGAASSAAWTSIRLGSVLFLTALTAVAKYLDGLALDEQTQPHAEKSLPGVARPHAGTVGVGQAEGAGAEGR